MTITQLQPQKARKVPRYERFTVDTEVEIDASDLHEAGWHHEYECPSGTKTTEPPPSPSVPLLAALESLHHQAHGAAPFTLCQREPCRSLTLDQLRGAA